MQFTKRFLILLLPYIVIVLLSFFAIRPLFHEGFFTMHDDEQIARLFEMKEGVSFGQFPVRWGSRLGFGFGYPIFNFYPPFVYYLGVIFHFVGFSLISSTKIVMGLGFILAAAFMYLWVKKYHGRLAGITASVLYTYTTYHIVDLYVRGALSEFFSFVFIPAVFWSLGNLAQKKSLIWMLAASTFLACVVLTHTLVALPLIPFVLLYIGFLLFQQKKEWKKLLILYGITGFLALGLSGFFWIPSLLEKKYTLTDTILTRELASYKIHFLTPGQLWQMPWGYGGSTEGTADGISLKVGKIHLLVSFAALIVAIFFRARRKKARTLSHTLFIGVLLLFSIFMTVPLSKFIWDVVYPLWYLQFPWRFLLFVAVFTSFLGGVFIDYAAKFIPRLFGFLLAVCIIFGSIFILVRYIEPQGYLPVDDTYYTTNNDIEWRVSQKSYEYMAKNTATKKSALNTTIIDINESDIPSGSYTSLSPTLSVSETKNTPTVKEYLTKGNGMLQINTNYFPGWNTYVDGRKVPFLVKGKFQLITLSVPDGGHTVSVILEDTLIRKVANIISFVSSFIFIFVLYYYFAKRRRNVQ